MCGLAGVVSFGRPIADPAALSRRLAGLLAHRGPDGEGVWVSPSATVVLAHRRLAIIDLSGAAAQPMATPDARYRIVFNGEIYNFRQLRAELEARDDRFATVSDTEVLLRLVVRDGPDALARARGMFALAIWDSVDRSLLLARDRFGMKPLYVAARSDAVAFASEIRTLVGSGLAPHDVSAAGVLGYLGWGSVPPPLTWIAGVEPLAAGAWVRWAADGRREERTFADVGSVYALRPNAATGVDDFRDRVRRAVEDSVSTHLVGDVPVGVFLSGGIDSSAIVSAATTAGAGDLRTYTVRFDDASSEHAHARRVAESLNTRHEEIVVESADVVHDLPRILGYLDQPTIDGVNSYYVSRAVARTGVKAVLSGTGGDEMFGGYPSFTRLPSAARIRRRLGPIVPLLAPAIGAALPRRLGPRWREFAGGSGRVEAAYRVQRGLFMPAELREIAGPAIHDQRDDAVNQLRSIESTMLNGTRASTLEGDVARLETRIYLRSQLLRDLDAMSMAHSLEVRLPFVDHVLLETVWPALGAHPALMRNKRILHETLAHPLPPAAVDRPKQGFTLPFARWIGGELQPFVREGMDYLVVSGWIAKEAPEAAWRAWRRGASHWSRVWALGVLGEFLRSFEAIAV